MILFALTLWKILGIIAAIGLILYFGSGMNSLWGGATGGAIIGIIAAFFRKGSFDWYFVLKFIIVGVLIGIFLEINNSILERLKKRN